MTLHHSIVPICYKRSKWHPVMFSNFLLQIKAWVK